MESANDGSGQPTRLDPDGQNRLADLSAATTTELIDHIVKTHHAYLWRELPRLSQFVTGLYWRHGATHPELAELHIRFHQMKEEMEHHMFAEEEAIFPLIRQTWLSGKPDGNPRTFFTIGELEDDHSELIAKLRVIRDITVDCHLPDDAIETFRTTFRKLREMEMDIQKHIHIESDLLFPKYRELCGA
jgi:regulator of cell morphogenesis and NO signaling